MRPLFTLEFFEDVHGNEPVLEPAKILLRVFCHAHGDRIILLLAGYDKGERPNARYQQAQIGLARSRLKAWISRRAVD